MLVIARESKIKIFKANEKYKKSTKSGKKINTIMLGDLITKGDYSMNKKEEDKTIIRIVVLVASILLMKIGNEYLGVILFALFVTNDIILIIRNRHRNKSN
mgnify:CR=1 FL=1